MLCNNCGNQLEEGDVFCGMCGNSLYQKGQSVMDTYSTKTAKNQTYTEPVNPANDRVYTEPANPANDQVYTEPVNPVNRQIYTELVTSANSQAYTYPVMQENNSIYAYQQKNEAKPKKKRRWPIIVLVLGLISIVAAFISPMYLVNLKKEDAKAVVEKLFKAAKNDDVEKFAGCFYPAMVNTENEDLLVDYMEAFSDVDLSIGEVKLGSKEEVNAINEEFYAENKVKISDACIVYCKLTNGGKKIDLKIILFLIDGKWYIDNRLM